MKSFPLALLGLCLAALGGCREGADEPADRYDVGPEAARYLDTVAALIRVHSLYADTIAVDSLREDLYRRSVGAESPDQVYGAITASLAKLGGGGNRLIPVEEMRRRLHQYEAQTTEPPDTNCLPRGGMIDGLGIIVVPRLRAECVGPQTYADALGGTVRALHRAGARRFVIDLRRNDGEDVYPMLVGLSPLLGSGRIMQYVTADWLRLDVFSYSDRVLCDTIEIGRLSLREPLPDAETASVVVLVGSGTVEAGEWAAVAFRGRDNTLIVGTRTAGRTVGTAIHLLPDGVGLVLEESRIADRTGAIIWSAVEPDIVMDWSNPAEITREELSTIMRLAQ